MKFAQNNHPTLLFGPTSLFDMKFWDEIISLRVFMIFFSTKNDQSVITDSIISDFINHHSGIT